MGNTYSGDGAAGSNCFNLSAGAGTVAGATSVAGSPCINLVAGSNITLTGTAPNQITIASSGGGGGGMTSWTLSGDSGPNQTITDANTVDIAGGTGLSTVASATDTVTVSLDNTAVPAGTYGSSTAVGVFTVDAQGRLTAASDVSITASGTINTGVANEVAYYSAATTIDGDTQFTFDPATGVVTNAGNTALIQTVDTTNNYAITLLGGGGPKVQWGDTDSANNSFMEMGAFSGINNLDTQARDFRIFGTNAGTLQYMDESAGTVGIGGIYTSANLPTVTLSAGIEDGGTNTVLIPFSLERTSSAVPAVGIGVGMQFVAETAAANNEIGATIEAVTTDVGAGVEDFNLQIKTMSDGAAATLAASFTSLGNLVVVGRAGISQNPVGVDLSLGAVNISTLVGDGTNNNGVAHLVISGWDGNPGSAIVLNIDPEVMPAATQITISGFAGGPAGIDASGFPLNGVLNTVNFERPGGSVTISNGAGGAGALWYIMADSSGPTYA